MRFPIKEHAQAKTDLEQKRPLSNGRGENKPSLVSLRNDL
jgi:hypothetical protein